MSDSARGLRIVFAGTPDFAATNLQALLDTGHNVIGVYTQQTVRQGGGVSSNPAR